MSKVGRGGAAGSPQHRGSIRTCSKETLALWRTEPHVYKPAVSWGSLVLLSQELWESPGNSQGDEVPANTQKRELKVSQQRPLVR